MHLKKIASGLWRVTLIAHRYLGIAMGILMTMWFLSGIVMMYVAFPHITEVQRVRTLAPIPWATCCRFGNEIAADEPVLLVHVENMSREPVLRLRRAGKSDAALDLTHGLIVPIDIDRARAVALDAAPRIIGSRDEAQLECGRRGLDRNVSDPASPQLASILRASHDRAWQDVGPRM